MVNSEHKNAVMEELKKTMANDRMKVSISDFSALGLVEMTRKRTRESLAHILCEPCPVCHGQGQVKTPQTICYEIMRDIMREAKQFSPREFRILASQIVIDLFLERIPASGRIGRSDRKTDFIAGRIRVHAEPV